MLTGLAYLHLLAGRDAEGLRNAQQARQELPSYPSAQRAQAIALVRLGRIEEARDSAQDVLTLEPSFTVASWPGIFRDRAFMESGRAALRAAGIPD